MKTLIKICGLTTQESVDVAVQSGADLIGFVFAKTSPRCISPEQARQLSESIPEQVKTTAVMLHPSDTEVQEVFDKFPADYLQTDAEDFASLNLPEGCRPLKVYRDLPGFDPSDIDPQMCCLCLRVKTAGSESWSIQVVQWRLPVTRRLFSQVA